MQGYGYGKFTVGGDVREGAILLTPTVLLPWHAATLADVTIASLGDFLEKSRPEILLLGTGAAHLLPSRTLRDEISARGVALEHMDTGAACRTYNILMLEDRLVAAALLPL